MFFLKSIPIFLFFNLLGLTLLVYFVFLRVSDRGGTVHVFVPNHHGTDLSVRCMRPYDEYRQFTLNPEGGARSSTTLFDNRQQKNSECQRWPVMGITAL